MHKTTEGKNFYIKSFMAKINIFHSGLLLLFLFHTINNIIVVLKDTTPFIADASEFYRQSFYYCERLLRFIKCGDFQIIKSVFHLGLQGQLLSLVSIPFYFVLGISHDVAIIGNQLFFLILILSIFGIGRVLFNRMVGFLAAFIISFYPAVFGFSRVYMLTFPILAISTLCIFLLIKSDGFKNRKYSIYFGLASGLGGLLRPRFIIYIIIPVFYYIMKNIIALYRQRNNSTKSLTKQIAINISLSIASSYLLLFPWYSLADIFEYFYYQGIWSSMPHFSKINSTLPYYLKVLFKVQLHWLFASLFLVGLVISLFDQNKRKKIYFLLMWLVLSLILLSSFGLKEYNRLVIPLCTPIALVSAAGLEILLRKKIKIYVLFILLFLSMAQYFFISYSQLAAKGIYSSIPVINRAYGRRFFFDIALSQGLLQANNDDWKINEIVLTFKMRRNFNKEFNWKYINKNLAYLRGLSFSDPPEDFIKVLFIEFCGSPISNAIEERILFDNLPITRVGLYPDDFDYKKLFSDKDLQHMVLGADYVIRFKIEPQAEIISQIVKIFNENIFKFEKLKTIETPWGECMIYGAKIEGDKTR